jgi:hypothetical protein
MSYKSKICNFSIYNDQYKELDLLNILKSLEFIRLKKNIKEVLCFINSDICCSAALDLVKEYHFNITLSQNQIKNSLQIDDIYECSSCFGDYSLVSFYENCTGEKINFENSKLDPSLVYSVKDFTRLGDSLAIIAGLESYCKSNNIDKIRMLSNSLLKDIVHIFDINHIKLINETQSNCVDLSYVYRLSNWNTPWLKRFSTVLSLIFNGNNPIKTNLELHKDLKENFEEVVYCQFDTRSSNKDLILESQKIIGDFTRTEIVKVLGGYDTPKYLGNSLDYILGDIETIIKKLLSCKYFIGCDSGIGHLAGVLEVKSYIFNFTDYDPVYNFFKDYENTTVIPYNIIKLIK